MTARSDGRSASLLFIEAYISLGNVISETLHCTFIKYLHGVVFTRSFGFVEIQTDSPSAGR